MSTYILLDSFFKEADEETASDYTVTTTQTNNWPVQPRTISSIPQDMCERPLDFFSYVNVQDFLVYYDSVTPEPYLKMNFYNTETNDNFFVNTIDNNQE